LKCENFMICTTCSEFKFNAKSCFKCATELVLDPVEEKLCFRCNNIEICRSCPKCLISLCNQFCNQPKKNELVNSNIIDNN